MLVKQVSFRNPIVTHQSSNDQLQGRRKSFENRIQLLQRGLYGLFCKVTCRKRLVMMPRTALLTMRSRTKGFAREERAPMVKALESSPFIPSSKALQMIESRYMKTFWIMMSMSAPFPLIKNSL